MNDNVKDKTIETFEMLVTKQNIILNDIAGMHINIHNKINDIEETLFKLIKIYDETQNKMNEYINYIKENKNDKPTIN